MCLKTGCTHSLSVYGKSVVIKTIALSKLSHLAMVLPDLKDSEVKNWKR